MERVVLASGQLTAVLTPAQGGKLVSLKTGPDGYEFMCQPAFAPHTSDPTRYTARDAYGFDELFPGALPEPYPVEPYQREQILDHGNLWSRRWKHRCRDDEAELWIVDDALGYRFDKRLWFADARTLVTEYTVQNHGRATLHWLYSAHILLPFHDDVDLELPPAEYTRLEEYGQTFPQRATGDESLLVHGCRFPSGTAAFYMSNQLHERSCAYHERSAQRRLSVSWTQPLFFLGLWYNLGGWMVGQPVTHVGLEPCSAPFSGLADSVAGGLSNPLEPGDVVSWRLVMTYGLG